MLPVKIVQHASREREGCQLLVNVFKQAEGTDHEANFCERILYRYFLAKEFLIGHATCLKLAFRTHVYEFLQRKHEAILG